MDEFSIILKGRLRTKNVLREYQRNNSKSKAVVAAFQSNNNTTSSKSNESASEHIIGKHGCYCTACLSQRGEEWRIGDVNKTVVGPRNQWIQYVWGNNERGSLGMGPDGVREGYQVPHVAPQVREVIPTYDNQDCRVDIEREAKFVQLSSGYFHTLMLTESGQVFATGDNCYGALGIESNDTSKTTVEKSPVVIEALSKSNEDSEILSIVAGGFSSYALVDMKHDTTGVDEKYAAALKKKEMALEFISRAGETPGTLAMLKTAEKNLDSALAKMREEHGAHCQVLSWGRNNRGELGHGTTTSECHTPTRIKSLVGKKVLQVSAGRQHVLIRTTMDGTFSFGNNTYGQLGLADKIDRYEPTKITELDRYEVVAVEAGDEHSAAITGTAIVERNLLLWGRGAHGRLGHNSEEDVCSPIINAALRGKRITSVSCGGAHTIAISDRSLRKDSGVSVWSFGQGAYGQLGHRDNFDCLIPKYIKEFRREVIVQVSAGSRHSMAITADGTLFGWGLGASGEIYSHEIDICCNAVVFPRKVTLKNIQPIGIFAGHGRSFVWGDKVNYRSDYVEPVVKKLCSAVPQPRQLTSGSLRILYRCNTCHFEKVCPVCAEECHSSHCLDLYWTDVDAISTFCHCNEAEDICRAISEEYYVENKREGNSK